MPLVIDTGAGRTLLNFFTIQNIPDCLPGDAAQDFTYL
jgi:hypothetical protein